MSGGMRQEPAVPVTKELKRFRFKDRFQITHSFEHPVLLSAGTVSIITHHSFEHPNPFSNYTQLRTPSQQKEYGLLSLACTRFSRHEVSIFFFRIFSPKKLQWGSIFSNIPEYKGI